MSWRTKSNLGKMATCSKEIYVWRSSFPRTSLQCFLRGISLESHINLKERSWQPLKCVCKSIFRRFCMINRKILFRMIGCESFAVSMLRSFARECGQTFLLSIYDTALSMIPDDARAQKAFYWKLYHIRCRRIGCTVTLPTARDVHDQQYHMSARAMSIFPWKHQIIIEHREQ